MTAYRPAARVVTVAPRAAIDGSAFGLFEHLRLNANDTYERQVVIDLEASAVAAVERVTQRLLTPRTVTLRLPGLPSGRTPIELPGGEVSTVTTVEADAVAIVGAVAIGDSPAVLVPASDWPTVVGDGYPVRIVYTAGYSVVPAPLVTAVKMLAAHTFAHREAAAAGQAVSEIPLGFEAHCDLYRIRPI